MVLFDPFLPANMERYFIVLAVVFLVSDARPLLLVGSKEPAVVPGLSLCNLENFLADLDVGCYEFGLI